MPRSCPHCHADFDPPAVKHGARKKFCSAKCGAAARSKRHYRKIKRAMRLLESQHRLGAEKRETS